MKQVVGMISPPVSSLIIISTCLLNKKEKHARKIIPIKLATLKRSFAQLPFPILLFGFLSSFTPSLSLSLSFFSFLPSGNFSCQVFLVLRAYFCHSFVIINKYFPSNKGVLYKSQKKLRTRNSQDCGICHIDFHWRNLNKIT